MLEIAGITLAAPGSDDGNAITALRWARLLHELLG